MRQFLLGSVMALTLVGCEPTQLYIAHNTVVGLDASVNAERTSGRLLVGYDRQFIALAPKAVRPSRRDGDEEVHPSARDAMSALSCTDVEVKGIFLTRYSERLATGLAARDAADELKSDADALFADCWGEKPDAAEKPEAQP
jgi:hypothetical protein